jgi:uncharacterized membrane protein (UPF0127 family)/SAM-dependent methyltransferase
MKDFIIKNSWPYTGSSDAEMGNSFVDTVVDSNEYDGMVPEKSVVDMQDIYGYAGGVVSPVEGHDWEAYWESDDKNKMEPSSASARLISLLGDGASVLDVCSGDDNHAEFMASKGFNVVAIDDATDASGDKDYGVFQKINGDIRYYNFGKKFDGFQALSCFEHISNYNIALENIYDQLRPSSYGLIHINNNGISPEDFESSLGDVGFGVIKKSNFSFERNGDDDEYTEFIVEKSDLGKIATVVVYSDFNEGTCPVSSKRINLKKSNYSYKYNDKIYNFSSESSLGKFIGDPELYVGQKAAFVCDVADSHREKVAGLQAYCKLNSGAGLLFRYSAPTDVLYHMGDVKYPIDIIFIDSDDRIKKIYKNIQPGSVAMFGCSNVKNVLEITGGLSEHLGISTGKFVDINNGFSGKLIDSNVKKILRLSFESGNKVLAKISSVYKTRSYKYMDNKILSLHKKSNVLVKNAGANLEPFTELYSMLNDRARNVHAFDIGSIMLDRPQSIRLYNNDKFVDVSAREFLGGNNLKNMDYKIVKGRGKSLYNFISNNGVLDDKVRDIFFKIISLSRDRGNRIVFVAGDNDKGNLAGELLLKKIEDSMGLVTSCIDYDILKVPDGFSEKETLMAIRQKYACSDPVLYINKAAGTKVSDGVKSTADNCVKSIDSAIKGLKSLKENFERNYSQYEQIQGDDGLIKQTKGKYHQSCNRSKKTAESLLGYILTLVRDMSGIKDVSVTEELTDSVIVSTKETMKYVQGVFDLIERIEDPGFVEYLSSETNNALNSISDCEKSLIRMRGFIYNDIMGIVSISPE